MKLSDIPLDKRKHFILGFIIALFGYANPLLFTLFILAAIGKEWWDSKGHGTPDWGDIAYTIAGGVIPMFIYIVLNYFGIVVTLF